MICVVLRSHETAGPFDQKNENAEILWNPFENHLNHLWVFRDFTFFTTLARPRKSRNLDEECSKTEKNLHYFYFLLFYFFRFSKLVHEIYFKKFSESKVFDTFWLPFVSFLTWSCHENTLVLPEQQKIIFENQVFTTEFRLCNTD